MAPLLPVALLVLLQLTAGDGEGAALPPPEAALPVSPLASTAAPPLMEAEGNTSSLLGSGPGEADSAPTRTQASPPSQGGVELKKNPKKPKSCSFSEPPDLPYYWEKNCQVGIPGCYADGQNVECRFCGQAPFTGIPCPDPKPAPKACDFATPPSNNYYWEPSCKIGMLGCFADSKSLSCRFCGGKDVYSSILCPNSACAFPNQPRTPYYWEPSCTLGTVGCLADGVHPQCRFCMKPPFDRVRCPDSLKIEPGRCTFPGLPPKDPYFWDPTCEVGKLGCWADGLHAECRWCGVGSYKDIWCAR